MKRGMMYLLFAVLLLLAAQAAFAANEITVTVTLQQVGVSVTPTSWALGKMAPGTSQTSWVSGNPGYFTATNDGNVAEDFTIAASSSAYWAPGLAVAIDTFVIGFGNAIDPYTSEPSYTTFTTATSFATSVPGGEDVRFDLNFTAPLVGSTYDAGGETFTVSLAASVS